MFLRIHCGITILSGEDMTATYIIAKTRVDVLVVPRLLFVRTGRLRQIDVLRCEMDSLIPTDAMLLRLISTERDWEMYKCSVSNNVVRRRRQWTCAKYEDVPASMVRESPTSFVRCIQQEAMEKFKGDILDKTRRHVWLLK